MSMFSSLDQRMMARAIELARGARYSARPNPAAGCVLARSDAVLGEGCTQASGGGHAETEALRRSGDAAGATAYVTLEPCAHQGKTPPCAAALLEAGIRRCVIAMRDPNPNAAGGAAMLEAAGVEVAVGLLGAEAEEINAGFCQRMRCGRPRARIKLAGSLDGRAAMASGESQWITSPAARADAQQLRALSGAIITGAETVLQDDPRLTVRDPALNIPEQPLRVVLDSRLRIPEDAALLRQPGKTLLVHTGAAEAVGAFRTADASGQGGVAFAGSGSGADSGLGTGLGTGSGAGSNSRSAAHSEVETLQLPGDDGRVDLNALLRELAVRQINDVLVESGPRLAGAFLQAGLADELILYLAPSLMGSAARPLLELPIAALADKIELTIADARPIGPDWRFTCLPKP